MPPEPNLQTWTAAGGFGAPAWPWLKLGPFTSDQRLRALHVVIDSSNAGVFVLLAFIGADWNLGDPMPPDAHNLVHRGVETFEYYDYLPLPNKILNHFAVDLDSGFQFTDTDKYIIIRMGAIGAGNVEIFASAELD